MQPNNPFGKYTDKGIPEKRNEQEERSSPSCFRAQVASVKFHGNSLKLV
jgi:hypothetical protein